MAYIQEFFALTIGSVTIGRVLFSVIFALILGFMISASYMLSGKFSKNFVISLVVLPALVATVLMLVSDNIVASVSVLGVFNLVRFRSFPGTAKEITVVFFTVAAGLAVGLGFNLAAVAVTLILCIALPILCRTKYGEKQTNVRSLRITIPESLDYEGIFDDVFEKYTVNVSLDQVKTTNLGTMFELRYTATFKRNVSQKEFIDEIRCRNGNLTVICSKPQVSEVEL